MFRTPRLRFTTLLGIRWLSERPARRRLQPLTWNAQLAADPVVQEDLVGNYAMEDPVRRRHTPVVDAQCEA